MPLLNDFNEYPKLTSIDKPTTEWILYKETTI